MTRNNSFAAALWLLGAAVAFAVAAPWADAARSGMMQPWALVGFFWGVALLSVLIHYLSQGPDALRRYRLQHKAATTQRIGARLGK